MYLLKFLNKLFNPENLWILFFLVLSESYSKQISVQDEINSEGLPEVVIYNEDKSLKYSNSYQKLARLCL